MTINDLYEKGISIFALLQEKAVPWKSLEISGELDTIFKNIKAKNLICNSLCEDISGDALAGIVYSYNIENWQKLWENYTAKYNPIDNYNRHEETVLTDTGNDTTVKNGSMINTMAGSTTATDMSTIYGYNSDNATNVSGGQSSVTPDTTTTDTYNNIEDKRTLNTEHKTVSDISGNVGVTTSAQMIDENIKLWKWNYFDDVFDTLSDGRHYHQLPGESSNAHLSV